MHRILSIVLVIALTILTIHSSPAAEFTVTTVTELRNALTTASSNGEDDIITVATGTYNVTSVLYYSPQDGDGILKIVAQNFRALPLLDGSSSSGRIMVLRNNTDQNNPNDSGADIIVEGMVFRNGSHGGLSIFTQMAGIQMSKCLFMNNQGDYSGAGASLRSDTGLISIRKNTFLNNSGTLYGGGLYGVTKSGTVHVTENHFSGNMAMYGGGVGSIVMNSGSLVLINNTFRDNTALSTGIQIALGGAIWGRALQGSCRLSGNLIIDNMAFNRNIWGGGSRGGGTYLNSKKAIIENNFFVNNRALMGGGLQGKLASSATTWKLTNNTLWRNHATDPGGGGGAGINIFNDDANITITNNIIRDNSSGGPTGDDLWIGTDMDGNGTASTVNLKYNLLGPHSDFASGHSDDLYITNTDHYHHHDNGTDDPRLRDNGHLPSGSPAINRGICGMWIIDPVHGNRFYYRIAPQTDRDGDPRPGNGATGGCDIGADEYHFPWPMFLPAIVRPHLNPFSIPTHPSF